MKFVTTKTETSLSDLARNVFDIHGSKATALNKQAQAALRQANPHLSERAKLPAGTLVVVPDVPGMDAARSQSLTDVSAELMAQLKQTLAAAKAVLEQSVENQKQAAEASAALVKSREMAALARQTPELQQRLAKIAEQAKARVKEIEAVKTVQLQGLAQLGKDLGKLTP